MLKPRGWSGNASYRGGGWKLAETVPKHKACQWMEGEVRERNFCGAPVKPGSSWCEEHHARVFVPAKVKKEGAAVGLEVRLEGREG